MKRKHNADADEFAIKNYGAIRNQHISYAMYKAVKAAEEAEKLRRIAQEVARRKAAEARRAARRAALRKAPQFCLCRAERELRWP